MTTLTPVIPAAVRDEERVVRIAAGGSAVILLLPPGGLPQVLHWGADPGPLNANDLRELNRSTQRGVSPRALDEPWPLTVLPTEADGWAGRPGLLAQRGSELVIPDWQDFSVELRGDTLTYRATSQQIAFDYSLKIDDAGLVHLQQGITNLGTQPMALQALEATMPVGSLAHEVLDFTGRWTRERVPQRTRLTQGSNVRESRRGRTGHDSPFLLVLGTPGFTHRAGEVWATHLAWSGDSIYPESTGRPLT